MRPTKFLSLSWLFFSHSYVTDFLHYLFPTDLLQWHKKVVFFKQFVRWTLLLSVKYLLFNCWIYLQKKNILQKPWKELVLVVKMGDYFSFHNFSNMIPSNRSFYLEYTSIFNRCCSIDRFKRHRFFNVSCEMYLVYWGS